MGRNLIQSMSKKLIAAVVSTAMVIAAVGVLPVGVKRVEAASKTVNASDSSFSGVINGNYPEKVDVLTINMDASKTVDAIFGNDVVIKGSGTLTVRQTIYVVNLTIENGANVIVKGEELGNDYDQAVKNEFGGSMNIKGNLTVHSTMAGLRCRGPLNINGGNLTVDSVVDPIVCDENITINGGTLKADMSLGASAEPLYGTVAVKSGYNIIMNNGVKLQGGNEISLSKVVSDEGDFLTYLCEDSSYALHILINKTADPYGSSSGGSSSGAGTGSGSASGSSSGSSNKYSNEWVNGKWYDGNGNQTYSGTLSWKSNGSGWWVEDNSGWYPSGQWQKIDGKWYYFDGSGYMASNEWRDGYWIGSDGSIGYEGVLSWKSDSYGWWVEDSAGWYPVNQWQKIDGSWYYFYGDGYMAVNCYVDGYWLGADGACW